MLFWFMTLMIILAASVIYGIVGIDREFWYLAIAFSVLIFISGFRALDIGTDTLSYGYYFGVIGSCSDLSAAYSVSNVQAPLFVAYEWLVYQICGSYRVLLMLDSLITGVLIARFVYRSSSNVVISTIVYILLCCFFQSMNASRQYLAIALGINAYLELSSRGLRYVSGWLMMGLAIGIHTPSMIYLVVVALALMIKRSSDTKRFLFWLFVVIAASALLLKPMLRLFMLLVPYYQIYEEGGAFDIFAKDSQGRIVILYLFLFIIVCFDFVKRKGGEPFDPMDKNLILYPAALIAVVWGGLFAQTMMMNRLVMYLFVVFVSFLPNAFERYRRSDKMLLTGGSLAILGVWWVMQLLEDKEDVLHYVLAV